MTLDALELILWDKFIYLYDFGDNWVHEVEVKSIQPDEAGEAKVMLLGGARACPPEDCGGVGGYDDMLLVLRDPKHPEHQEFLDWLGGSYDPDAFSKQKIEQALKKIKIRK